ncbi:MAG: RHS repeat-associated core domain-containing protein [Pseudomonas fluorescens]|nr:RHS repeat-associated core domain-containing protein [Pseudomonas fluorescens]
MLPNRETLLCRYHYDPLDRLVDCTPSAQAPAQRFYLKDRLATEIQDAVQRSIMQHDDQLLAQQQRQSGVVEARLLVTDQQRSVLNVLDVARPHPLAYSPYGHRPAESSLLSLLGFNGERPDPVTGWYLLGNGYRAFNSVLMRFNSPDSWSPFGEGGLNAYVYCVGDPVNRTDPSGHISQFVKNALLKGSSLKLPRHVAPKNTRARTAYIKTPDLQIIKNPTHFEPPSNTTRGVSEPPPQPKVDLSTLDYIGTHGSTTAHHNSLTAGLHSNFMNSASGLSSGPGFYVSPTRRTAVDFSEIAASYSNNGTPHVYEVYVSDFSSMTPGRHYRYGTMGEGGLIYRSLNEMEIVLHERIYRRVSIHATEIRRPQVLPRASEAPF